MALLDNNLTDEEVEVMLLTAELHEDAFLEFRDFIKCIQSCDGAHGAISELIKIVLLSPCLTSISLASNELRPRITMAVPDSGIESLEACIQPQHLNEHVEVPSVSTLLFAVAHSTRLISIDLSDNYLVGNTIAGMLGELIRANTVLVRLILRRTRLGVVALSAITSALTENSGSLEELDLSENMKLSWEFPWDTKASVEKSKASGGVYLDSKEKLEERIRRTRRQSEFEQKLRSRRSSAAMSTLRSMSIREKEHTESVGRAKRRKSSLRRGSNVGVNAKQIQRRSLSQFEVMKPTDAAHRRQSSVTKSVRRQSKFQRNSIVSQNTSLSRRESSASVSRRESTASLYSVPGIERNNDEEEEEGKQRHSMSRPPGMDDFENADRKKSLSKPPGMDDDLETGFGENVEEEKQRHSVDDFENADRKNSLSRPPGMDDFENTDRTNSLSRPPGMDDFENADRKNSLSKPPGMDDDLETGFGENVEEEKQRHSMSRPPGMDDNLETPPGMEDFEKKEKRLSESSTESIPTLGGEDISAHETVKRIRKGTLIPSNSSSRASIAPPGIVLSSSNKNEEEEEEESRKGKRLSESSTESIPNLGEEISAHETIKRIRKGTLVPSSRPSIAPPGIVLSSSKEKRSSEESIPDIMVASLKEDDQTIRRLTMSEALRRGTLGTDVTPSTRASARMSMAQAIRRASKHPLNNDDDEIQQERRTTMAEAIRRASKHPMNCGNKVQQTRRTTMADAIRRASKLPSTRRSIALPSSSNNRRNSSAVSNRRGSRRPSAAISSSNNNRRMSRRPSALPSSTTRRLSRRPSALLSSTTTTTTTRRLSRRPSALPQRRPSSLMYHEGDEDDEEEELAPPGLNDFGSPPGIFEDIEEHEDEIHYQERRVSSMFIEDEEEDWVPKSIAAHLCFAAHFSCLKRLKFSNANLQESTAKEIVRVLEIDDTVRRRFYKSDKLHLNLEENDEISEKTLLSLDKVLRTREEIEEEGDDRVDIPVIQFKLVDSSSKEKNKNMMNEIKVVDDENILQVEDVPSPHAKTSSSTTRFFETTRRKSFTSVHVVIRSDHSFLCFADFKTRQCTALSPDSTRISIESTPVRDRFVLTDTSTATTGSQIHDVWQVLRESSRRTDTSVCEEGWMEYSFDRVFEYERNSVLFYYHPERDQYTFQTPLTLRVQVTRRARIEKAHEQTRIRKHQRCLERIRHDPNTSAAAVPTDTKIANLKQRAKVLKAESKRDKSKRGAYKAAKHAYFHALKLKEAFDIF